MRSEIYPSVLVHNYNEYILRLEMIEGSEAEWAQVDFMDGTFIEQMTVQPSEIAEVATRLKLEAHLMVNSPDNYLEDLRKAGFQRVVVHREIYGNFQDCAKSLEHIGKQFPEVGLAINPETAVEDYRQLPIASIQCMGVHPGASGQLLLDSIYAKIKEIEKQKLSCVLAVDGGVNEDNIRDLQTAGFRRFIMASAIFANHNPEYNLQRYIQIITA